MNGDAAEQSELLNDGVLRQYVTIDTNLLCVFR